MSKIATDKEQYRQLTDSGLDPSSADMIWISGAPSRLEVIDDYTKREEFDEYDTPAWSLSKLLRCLPLKIKVDGEECFFTVHRIVEKAWRCKNIVLERYEMYEICYMNKFGYGLAEKSNELVDAAVVMLCSLLEKGHVRRVVKR